MKRTDRQRLDALQKLKGKYSKNIICRWSDTGRGWRLHESSRRGSVKNIRLAIDNFLDAEENKKSRKSK